MKNQCIRRKSGFPPRHLTGAILAGAVLVLAFVLLSAKEGSGSRREAMPPQESGHAFTLRKRAVRGMDMLYGGEGWKQYRAGGETNEIRRGSRRAQTWRLCSPGIWESAEPAILSGIGIGEQNHPVEKQSGDEIRAIGHPVRAGPVPV